jgi:5'(3')-deoxyribonucleotidase
MSRIAISVNEVLRDFLSQFIYTYDKYIEPTNLKVNDIVNFNLSEQFRFSDNRNLNTFLYLESPLEIFGHADQLNDGLMNHFNNLIMMIKDDGDHRIEITSREVDKSIPSTYFFLSKTGCKIENIRFVQQHSEEWGDNDILITANPVALENKPSGRISVKVKAPYNKNVSADYEIDSILDFIKDEELRNKILNTTITSYEEIKN